jgi:hypothetical protein
MLKRGMATEIPSSDELKKNEERKIPAGFLTPADAARVAVPPIENPLSP